MSGEHAKVIGTSVAEQLCEAWSASGPPEFRDFLDHVAELIAHDYVRRMRETADPEVLRALERGGPE
jgi:ubiquinone biosynthesis protein UbiJ